MKNLGFNERAIEKYILGELSEKRMREIERHSIDNIELREEIERRKKADIDFLNQYPPDSAVEEIFNRLMKRRMNEKRDTIKTTRTVFFKRILYAAPALVLVIIILSLNFPIFRNNQSKSTGINNQEGVRPKGSNDIKISGPHLIVIRKSNGHTGLLKNGDRAKAGDIIQLAYVSIEESHGVILSIDGNGKVTLHFPNEKSDSTALEQGKRVRLPTAFLLDNAPEFERFFFVTSNSEIEVEQVIKRAEYLAKNLDLIKNNDFKLNEKFKQYSLLIKKERKDEK